MARDPDLKLGGLALWAIAREFPDSQDYWDGNWLQVRVRMEDSGARVEVSGPWIRNTELAGFAKELEALDRDLAGQAELDCLEPNLNVKVTAETLGHLTVVVSITPDHLTQSHTFTFWTDQTYLRPVIRDCRAIIERFPVRDAPE